MIAVSERAKLYLEDSASSSKALCWYALWTRSRHEKHVRDQLVGQGIDPFLPIAPRMNQWKDRRKLVEFPLFPGYCFARFVWSKRHDVLRLPGVVSIIGGSGRPEPIPDHEIESIKKLTEATVPYGAHPYLREGTKVRIVRGPLEGVEGILSREENRHRVVISVNLIRQAAAIEVSFQDIEAA